MGSAPAASQEYVFLGASQADSLSDMDAWEFVQKRLQQWEETRAQGAEFTTDLSDGMLFAWDHFLARSVASREVEKRGGGVDSCWLVWVGREWERPGFYLRFADGSETVYVRFSKGGWRCEDSMVADILWRV